MDRAAHATCKGGVDSRLRLSGGSGKLRVWLGRSSGIHRRDGAGEVACQGRWPCTLLRTTVGCYPRSASHSCSRPSGAAQSRGGDMRRYEVMVILDPSLEDKDAKAAVDRFLTTVSSRGGEIQNIDHWGERRRGMCDEVFFEWQTITKWS